MAELTIESCLSHADIESRFDLVLKASKRAHALELGAAPLVPDDSKPTVLALREIAAGLDIIGASKEPQVHSSVAEEDVSQEQAAPTISPEAQSEAQSEPVSEQLPSSAPTMENNED